METSVAILEREPIRIPDTPAELLGEARQNLANRAKKVLGYKPLLKSIKELKTAKQSVEARVAELFSRLGIAPFTEESVTAYQQQERERVRTWRHKWVDVCLLAFGVSLLLGTAAFIVTGIATLMGKPLGWYCTISGITALISAMVGVLVSAIWEQVGDWEWRSVLISEYQQPVPEAALEMAIALKQAWPTAVMEIESLSYGPRTSDPFLVFKVKEGKFTKRYYVGVWGEPNFQAEFR